jgi:uncharacterized protein YdhG (YjbR/CyaY superfamily)
MKPQTVDEYIATAPKPARANAAKLRALIKKAAPKAEEKLSYGMPYYSYNGRLIYWGAHEDYLGLYVMAASREAMASEIEPYRTAKATLHLSVKEPLPDELITKLVKVQLAANIAKIEPGS